jgi:nucleosome binding factor SPN SPT16 subunit
MDVVINKPFKDSLRKLYEDWLINGNHMLTKGGNLKKPTVTNLCQWILQAWENINPNTIIRGFKKCSISNFLDGTEDDMLWAPIEDENETIEEIAIEVSNLEEDSTTDQTDVEIEEEKITIEVFVGEEDSTIDQTDDDKADNELYETEDETETDDGAEEVST